MASNWFFTRFWNWLLQVFWYGQIRLKIGALSLRKTLLTYMHITGPPKWTLLLLACKTLERRRCYESYLYVILYMCRSSMLTFVTGRRIHDRVSMLDLIHLRPKAYSPIKFFAYSRLQFETSHERTYHSEMVRCLIINAK